MSGKKEGESANIPIAPKAPKDELPQNPTGMKDPINSLALLHERKPGVGNNNNTLSAWGKLKELAGNLRNSYEEKIDLGELLLQLKSNDVFKKDYPETSAILSKYENKNIEARQVADIKTRNAAIDWLMKEYENKALKKYLEEKTAVKSR